MPENSFPFILAAVLAFLCSSVGCFIAGVACAPTFRDWQIRRAGRHFKALYAMLVGELERSERIARLASEAVPDLIGQREQHRFSSVRDRLADILKQVASMSGCVDKMDDAVTTPVGIVWQIASKDPQSGLPDRTSFEQNLGLAGQESKRYGKTSGLVVFRMDKADQLVQRLGAEVCESMRQKMCSVAIRSIRETDLLGRLGEDLFAIIAPDVSPEEGERLAQQVRSSVRRHRFRADDSGTEVLVTASFGYATCWPEEQPTLALERAMTAVDRSMRSGRNQLHFFDTDRAILCPITELVAPA